MSLPLEYRPEVRDDVDTAYARYEGLRAGLGDEFLKALRDQLDRIEANPALYGVLFQDVRAARLRRFPYVVYYRLEPSRIFVLAVQHGGGNPQTWQSRA
jgi:plasmid stabilization system protein ParE